jgi:hypothetical protein
MQIGGLIVILIAVGLSWTHMAFGWFDKTAWYDPLTFGLLLIFLIVQVRMLVWMRKNRA